MRQLLVTRRSAPWAHALDDVEVVNPRRYLTDPSYAVRTGQTRVVNLSRSYRYQSLGYYVSLLAEARGHRPIPSVATMQDLRHPSVARVFAQDLDALVQRSLRTLKSSLFFLSIYFGRNMARRYDRLCAELYATFPAPFLRAHFERVDSLWQLRRIAPLPASEIPSAHMDFVREAAEIFFRTGRPRSRRGAPKPYDLAILVDPEEAQPPSDEGALQRFEEAAFEVGFSTERIRASDAGEITRFDALFIRATTAVEHPTYRIARRAEGEGMVAIDDPRSILRCTNKVYLAELLERHRIPRPRTMIVHRRNAPKVAGSLGVPCVLKEPDGAFSMGVVRADDPDTLKRELFRLLETSDLVIAQEYLPTEYDWRIGVLDGKPLFACRYYMAPEHWQIIDYREGDPAGRGSEGNVETVALDSVPMPVLRTALRAASPIGHGLYGVDLKEARGRCVVVEVNDNPSIEAGYEDRKEGMQLYLTLARSFACRLEQRRRAFSSSEA